MKRQKKYSKILLPTIAFIGWIVTAGIFLNGCSDKTSFPEEIEAKLPENIDFNYHIKPILSDRCFACHGPDENKIEGGLRLDIEEKALAELESGFHAIVPGKPGKSALYHRITSEDPEEMMPPPESNLKLTEQEKALLIRWIEQGAEYKPHWSFIQPEKPEEPEISRKDWPNNPIDNFVMARLEQENMEPAEQADKESLIRRVSFDLTGLPPSVEEIDAFLADDSPEAYEKVVDRLLASPHYGERMANEWMDVARYADSHGYQDDGMRNMSPWRDWVIEAFNKNLPFDKFVTWQLAGDMLPDANREQILATGFNRNHLQSQEGGIVSEEYRVEYVADRVGTFGKAFLGLTVECARCHDHKYDPISQKEFFELFSFFNNNNETGQIPYMGEASPTLILTDEKTEEELVGIRAKMETYNEKTDPDRKAYREDFEKWAKAVENSGKEELELFGLIGHYPLDEPQDKNYINLANQKKPAVAKGRDEDRPVTVPGKFGNAQQLVGDGYIDLGEEIAYFERTDPFSISLWVNIEKDSVDGPLFTRSGGKYNGNRGYDCTLRKDNTVTISLNHTWPANGIMVHTIDKVPTEEWFHFTLTYDGSSKASGVKVFLNGEPMKLKVISDNLQQSMIYYGDNKDSWGGSGNLAIGKVFEETLADVMVDEFMVFNRKLSTIEVAQLSGESDALAKALSPNPENDRSLEEGLYDYYLSNYNQEYQQHFAQLTEWRDKENEVLTAEPEVMVMEELREPRPTYILDRGVYDAPTKRVEPGTPSYVMEFPEKLPDNRLGLAQWLVHEDNPLTTRVTVNRYWQMFFRNGIVSTPDDFGNQGDLPSHPELLDWLSVHFRESGWDIKALQKMIVMSATYQQSSVPTLEELEKDPANTLLARGPSYRMPAEMIRDNALAASGLFVPKIGGPSVYPYQPKGLWKALATRNATEYVQGSGDDLYRRSMYTVFKRTSPPPSMITFDAPERSLCTVKRQKTSTPLQALVLLNDPQFVEASRALAEKVMKEQEELDAQITYMFRALTSQFPTNEELAILKKLYYDEVEEFKNDNQAAVELLEVGNAEYNKNLPLSEVAALTLVTNTVMNFDEAVFKR